MTGLIIWSVIIIVIGIIYRILTWTADALEDTYKAK